MHVTPEGSPVDEPERNAGARWGREELTQAGARPLSPQSATEIIHYKRGDQSIHHMEYMYDDVGNRCVLKERPGPTADLITWNYHFDRLNRLVKVHRTTVDSSETMGAYEYDDSDNRIFSNQTEGALIGPLRYIHDDANQVRKIVSLANPEQEVDLFDMSYDPDGNLTTRTNLLTDEKVSYGWSPEGKLVRVIITAQGMTVTDVQYTYDSIGRMLTRKLSTDANPTRFEWDGWDLVREVAPDGVETVYYAPLSEILSFKRGNSVYQVHADALGSVRLVTAASGAALASFAFDAWGNAQANDAVVGSVPFRFIGASGVRTDFSSGLIFMRNRWYDHQTGRFLSRDPMRKFSTEWLVNEGNRYVYVRNNPTSHTDPTGLVLVVDPTASKPDQDKINALLDFLYQSPSGRFLIDKLHAAGVTIVLRRRGGYGHGVFHSAPDLGPADAWFKKCPPNQDYEFSPPDNKTYVDLDFGTAMATNVQLFAVLAHELGHAYQVVYYPNDFIWAMNFWAAEASAGVGYIHTKRERNAVAWENRVRAELGYGLRIAMHSPFEQQMLPAFGGSDCPCK